MLSGECGVGLELPGRDGVVGEVRDAGEVNSDDVDGIGGDEGGTGVAAEGRAVVCDGADGAAEGGDVGAAIEAAGLEALAVEDGAEDVCLIDEALVGVVGGVTDNGGYTSGKGGGWGAGQGQGETPAGSTSTRRSAMSHSVETTRGWVTLRGRDLGEPTSASISMAQVTPGEKVSWFPAAMPWTKIWAT